MAGPSLFDRGPLVATLALTALGLSVLNTATLLKYQFGSDETAICHDMPFKAPPLLFEHEDDPRHEPPRRHRFRDRFRHRRHRPDWHQHDHWHQEPPGSARFQTLFLIESDGHEAPRFEFFTCP